MLIFNKKVKISKNVIAPASQVIISGIILFVLYGYLYRQLGANEIGVWSLVVATISVSRLGDLGLSSGVVRFVAQALGKNNERRAADIIQTTAISLGVIIPFVLLAIYPVISLILSSIMQQDNLLIALRILPYSLVYLYIMIISSVFTGGLDGCMRIDIRSILTVISQVIFLGLVFYLVPDNGIVGVAIAQLFQGSFILITSWITLRHQVKALPILPFHWEYTLLKEIFNYGVKFQTITIMNLLIDPLSKILLAKFGNIEAVGYYEMANRLILQGRALIVESSRIIIPKTSSLQEKNISEQQAFFENSYQIILYITIIFYGTLGILIYPISEIWLGNNNETFISFSLILITGWFFNTLITPAYFSNLGTANLKPNIIAHIIIGLSTLILGVAFGKLSGELGVVIGLSISLATGSLFVNIEFFNRKKILTSIKKIHKEFYDLLATSLILNIINIYILYNYKIMALAITFLLTFLFIMLVPLTIKRIYHKNAG